MARGRRGTELSQYKMEPDILSQVNNICPSGQTVTIPSGDSDMDVPKRMYDWLSLQAIEYLDTGV